MGLIQALINLSPTPRTIAQAVTSYPSVVHALSGQTSKEELPLFLFKSTTRLLSNGVMLAGTASESRIKSIKTNCACTVCFGDCYWQVLSTASANRMRLEFG